MSEFVSKFIEIDDISFLGMRNTALSLLPNDRITLGKLYDDLKRGKGILDDEAHMNMSDAQGKTGHSIQVLTSE